MSFPEQLKKARISIGYTQQQIADIMGITNSTYCGYETGKRQPDVAKIKQIARILNISGDALLETGLDVPMRPQNNKTINSPQLSFKLDKHEINVITAYHQQPDMQPAIDRLLGVESEIKSLPVAARNGKSGFVKLAPEKEQERQKLIEEEFPELMNKEHKELPEF